MIKKMMTETRTRKETFKMPHLDRILKIRAMEEHKTMLKKKSQKRRLTQCKWGISQTIKNRIQLKQMIDQNLRKLMT